MKKLVSGLAVVCALALFQSSVLAQNSYISSPSAVKPPGLLQERLGPRLIKIATRDGEFRKKEVEFKRLQGSRLSDFKAKIQGFENKEKARIAEKINNQFNQINQRRTQQMLNNLEMMARLLNRLTGADQSATSSANLPKITPLEAESIEQAINEATAAVNAQALKDYTVSVSSESGILTDVRATRLQLLADLKAAHEKVVSVRQLLASVIKSLAGGDE
ncbi:MAG: hypothetical protein ACD_20C00336G0003 [uncultured bacterium]|nr:MAG: hypothetical protein ACD_20C00336G0003 [uncultured bacterium]